MAGKNTITRSVAPKSVFESAIALIDNTISFDQGDLLYLDTTAHLIKKMSSDTQSANCLGVAIVSVASGVLVGPYQGLTDVTPAVSDVPGPLSGVIAKLLLKSGDVITPGAPVYYDSGTRGVTVTPSTSTVKLAIYQGKGLTAVAGTEIECLILCPFLAGLG
jgi:hypothetical protein